MALLLTLTMGLGAALALGYVARRLHLSEAVGYLVAGVLVGPFTPGFVAHAELASELADIGIILLMFGVGLSFHLKELVAVRKIAVPGALFGVAVATALGVLTARSFGYSLGSSLVFGLSISAASTVVLTRVLEAHDAMQGDMGRIVIGWLVVEDMVAVLALVLLPVLAGKDGDVALGMVARKAGLALLSLGAFVALALVVGRRAIPWLLHHVARTGSRELFTLAVLVIALGISVGAAKYFGASMALGAFLAGLCVARSDHAARAAARALPMRDAFAVLFFVSVGMLLDPAALLGNIGFAVATLAVVLVGKPVAVFVAMRFLQERPRVSATVAVSLGQLGELSFVLAALGRELGLLDDRATQAIVVTSITTITLSPILFRRARSVYDRIEAIS